GDWVTQAESTSGPLSGCDVENSSWHGTRVAGIIGAASDNSIGVTGVTWNPKILPIRVLGKCGGWDSDIIDGMSWAAGLHVPGVPDNPQANWAKVENLSLGSTDPCTASYQTVMSQLTARGVIVVASAGNEAGPVDTPANCPGVVAVAGLRHGASAYPSPAGVPVCPASDPNTGECACTTSTCGAGMANAENALQGALRPMAIVTGPSPSSVTPGSTVNLSGSASFVADGR